MRQLDRLSARRVTTVCKSNKPGRYKDGGGLYLQIRNGGQSWIFRYRRRHGTNSKGKKNAFREMGLGAVASVSLADARTKRDKAYALLTGDADADPLTNRRSKRAVASNTKTFGAYCEDDFLKGLTGLKNEKHRAQWGSTLRTYAKPLWPLLLPDITVDDVYAVLDPIWDDKTETARRVRGRIEQVLSAAMVGKNAYVNPARWKGNLQVKFKNRIQKAKKHHPAVHFDDMPGFMRNLRKLKSTSARALEFTILTAARTGEVRGMLWQEVDLTKNNIWTVPPERMKANKEHTVPLSSRAIEILRGMKRGKDGDLVFKGAKPGEPLSDAALLMCLRGIRPGFTTHGFRSSFRDWAGDKTSFPSDLAEFALAHQISSETEAAYRRSTGIERRREMMAAWESYLAH